MGIEAWWTALLASTGLEFDFMRRAAIGCALLALGAAPVGVLLMLRRMSLMGDAMSHAILPGAALGYLAAGLSLPAMTLGGAGSAVLELLAAEGLVKPVLQLGLPDRFIEHGDPAVLLARLGLDAAGIERSVRERFGAWVAQRPALQVVRSVAT